MTANDFVNVRDIRNNIVYSKDNLLFVYLKIQPISLELLSQVEQSRKIRQFSAEFSSEKKNYKLFSISRPVDVSLMLNNFKNMLMETTDTERKKALNNEIKEINSFALSGEIIERQFYMTIWESSKKDGERELLKRANEITARFKSMEMSVDICKKGDIVKMLNLFANPNYAHLEDEEFEDLIPFVG